MDSNEEDLEDLADRWAKDTPTREPMRTNQRIRVNPTRDDLKVRRRNRRTSGGGEAMARRDELLAAASKAGSLSEQARLLDEVRQINEGMRAEAALGRELDFANEIVAEAMTPVATHVFHTAATDWLAHAETTAVSDDWQHRTAAEAAAWFGRTSAPVRQDPEEFRIQAEGMARRISGQFGLQAQAAAQHFLAYTTFLRTQAASGLDQVQQTIDPNNQPKTTPLPEDVFDNFAPPIHPINEGVSGTEDSNRAPLLQEIMGGGSGDDMGAPEKPGGHSTTDELSWAPPSGMQADTAPGWGDGDPGTPEKGGDRPDYAKAAGLLVEPPRMAIGGYAFTMDDFRRQAAVKEAEGLGKCVGCGSSLNLGNAADREGKVCKNCASKSASRREAASGLDQIDQTVDANNQVAPTPYPGEVAFPLTGEFQEEQTTNGTGQPQPRTASHKCTQCGKSVSNGKCSGCSAKCSCAECKKHTEAAVKQADMFGASDTPHAVPGPPVPNSPATTPPSPYGSQSAGEAVGRADANAGNDRATFNDASSAVPGFVNGVGEGYQQQMQQIMNGQPENTPGSMEGDPSKATTHAGAKTSSLIVTAAEREDPDFRKGYGYATAWTPGRPLVTQGSASFEAGVYAGISDTPQQQRAFVTAHRAVPELAARVDRHKQLTLHIAGKNEVGTNGLYLAVQAATSIELNTTAPNTTPAADGSTPINGRGNPGPLDGVQDAAAAGGPSPYNGAEPFGSPVVPGAGQTAPSPADALLGGGTMSTPNQVQSAFRKRVQASLLAEKGK